MAKLWQFLQGHPKPAFSEKLQMAEQDFGGNSGSKNARMPKLWQFT